MEQRNFLNIHRDFLTGKDHSAATLLVTELLNHIKHMEQRFAQNPQHTENGSKTFSDELEKLLSTDAVFVDSAAASSSGGNASATVPLCQRTVTKGTWKEVAECAKTDPFRRGWTLPTLNGHSSEELRVIQSCFEQPVELPRGNIVQLAAAVGGEDSGLALLRYLLENHTEQCLRYLEPDLDVQFVGSLLHLAASTGKAEVLRYLLSDSETDSKSGEGEFSSVAPSPVRAIMRRRVDETAKNDGSAAQVVVSRSLSFARGAESTKESTVTKDCLRALVQDGGADLVKGSTDAGGSVVTRILQVNDLALLQWLVESFGDRARIPSNAHSLSPIRVVRDYALSSVDHAQLMIRDLKILPVDNVFYFRSLLHDVAMRGSSMRGGRDSENRALLKLLLDECGANPTLRDNHGRTPAETIIKVDGRDDTWAAAFLESAQKAWEKERRKEYCIGSGLWPIQGLVHRGPGSLSSRCPGTRELRAYTVISESGQPLPYHLQRSA
jgi:hypothetical protein